ncbi:hypothetical protein [Nonomuraea fuscirosea]|uniref:hypothetical protein n=1 Tax=Nonomuraea fuscirosea TaxID=1291556 RepID=UPI000D05D8E4|nr:hypothetical protein [Nonomuraea fuscirosea]
MSELPEETGDERVDAIVARLGGLGELPVNEHVALFDEAFSGLESTLAAVDEPTAGQGQLSPDGGRPLPSGPTPGGSMPGGPTSGGLAQGGRMPGEPGQSGPMPGGPVQGGRMPGEQHSPSERPRPGGWLPGERAVGRP